VLRRDVCAQAARLGVAAAVACFWVVATVGAARQPGYDAARDYLSSLAALGSTAPGWGLTMFACAALALGCTSVVVRDLVIDAGAAAWAMLVAAVAVAVAGAARVTCVTGAAGCNAGALVVEQTTLLSRTHSVAVATYQVAFSGALLLLARAAHRDGRGALAGVALLAAVGTAALAVAPLPWGAGTDQRVWVAAGHLVLLALAAWPRRPSRRAVAEVGGQSTRATP
jgi:hypothetical protein